ncbi:hypothetical protein AS188_16065 (plasmid) [Kocuria flava]|uniref:Uncharacterized protein n=1 Tax=Kocuria flava TaxID=446860 RepID=A0A0U3HJM6_9MICC|nr:hypothetical protein [Kocuria flava]ALU41401.1 hypothetical protein AS188_16065 [Kocuria flava]GEO92181.1 hypothetical protein KFL01_14870 [Kocuria flava]
MQQRRWAQLAVLGGLFMIAVGAVPLWWSIGHLTSPATSELFAPWLGVLTGAMAVVLGVLLISGVLRRAPRQLSRRRSTRIMLVWWPIAGVLMLLSSWEKPAMAGVALFPFLVAFPVAALFEQPRQQQRYAQLITTRPHRVQAMIGVGVVGSVLFGAFGVLSAIAREWPSLGAFLAFFLMSFSYLMGARADRQQFASPGSHREEIGP